MKVIILNDIKKVKKCHICERLFICSRRINFLCHFRVFCVCPNCRVVEKNSFKELCNITTIKSGKFDKD
jgi:hypothetical protein